jgi:hypothetical protein
MTSTRITPNTRKNWEERERLVNDAIRRGVYRATDIARETGLSVYVISNTRTRCRARDEAAGVISTLERIDDVAKMRGLGLEMSTRRRHELERDARRLSERCACCGGEPTDRDYGRLTLFRHELLCSVCLMQPSELPDGRKEHHRSPEYKARRVARIVSQRDRN